MIFTFLSLGWFLMTAIYMVVFVFCCYDLNREIRKFDRKIKGDLQQKKKQGYNYATFCAGHEVAELGESIKRKLYRVKISAKKKKEIEDIIIDQVFDTQCKLRVRK